MEDSEIVELYWQRDESAVSETDRKYRNYLMTIAWNILGNREDCSECLNDTYLRAWNTIPPEKPRILPPFLSRIIRNLAIDSYRRSHREKRKASVYAECLDEVENMIASGTDPAKSTDLTVLTDLINEFLANLPKQARNLFVCRYYYMDSLKDAAAYSGMSQSAAKSALFRMRNDLREYLVREGYDL